MTRKVSFRGNTLNLFKTSVISASLLLSSLASADSQIVDVGKVFDAGQLLPYGVRADIGTTGYGGALLWSVSPHVGLALGYHGGDLSWRDDVVVNGNRYLLETHNNNIYLNLELFPFAESEGTYAKGFYVATGVAYIDQSNDLDRTVAAGQDFRVNQGAFTAGDNGMHIQGQMQYSGHLAPYVGIGFAPKVNREWGMFTELGAYYVGNPTVTLQRVSGGTDFAGNDQQLDHEINQEARTLRQKHSAEWLPVIKMGLNYYW